jgi:hypothetical protein
MGEEYDVRIKNMFNILNDLAKGQKFMMDLVGQLAKNSLEGPMKKNQNGDGGSNNGEGIHSCTTIESHPHFYTKSPRPTLPQFLGNDAIGPLMQVDQDEPYRAYLEEYKRLGDDFHLVMSFVEFCNMKSRN